jgi:TolB protein
MLKRAIWMQVRRNFGLLPGTFEVMKPQSFLERPPYNGVDIGTFYFKPWQQIKANGLIKIGLRKKSAKTFTLLFRFYDVDESKLIVRKDADLPVGNYRWEIQKLCDKIYKYLTYQPGIFSSMIAYVKRNRKGGKDIWVADFDGGNARRVVSNGAINVLPRWSPDGRFLLFTSYLTGGAYLYKLDIARKIITRVSKKKGTHTGGNFSPNGKRVAFSFTPRTNNSSDVYVANTNGTGYKRLTKSWGIDVSPSWSPDGKQIAFVSERFANPQIFLMNSDGSSQTRLTFKGNYNQEPRWSPRGNEIMFTARDEFLQYDLFVIKLEKDSSGTLKPTYRRLTQNQGTNLEACWSPDGRYILFVSTRVGERKLYIMNIDGSKQKLFIRGWGNYETPAWSPVMAKPAFPGGSTGRRFYSRIKLVGLKKTLTGQYVVDKSVKAPTPAKPKKQAKALPREDVPTGRKPTPKARKANAKTVARKPAARKPEARKPEIRKPDVRKPEARKPAVRPNPPKARTNKQDKPTAKRPPVRRTAPTRKRPVEKRTKQEEPVKRSQPAKRREG